MLYWANQYSVCCFLDNNSYQHSGHLWECIAAVNAVHTFRPEANNVLPALKTFLANKQDWLFGHFCYNSTIPDYQQTAAHLTDQVQFAPAFLFQPETVVELMNNKVVISTLLANPQSVYLSILSQQLPETIATTSISVQPRFTREAYLETLGHILHHIQRGDCYEINFCQEFYAENTQIAPYELFKRLNQLSPTPYAAFYKLQHQYALCASPERYLKKEGNTLISQPIKGTAKRITDNPEKDAEARQALFNSPKERSENVMVVDLVRNDMSRICCPGSVTVDELFGIYSFPQVHQMISTISGELLPGKDLADILEATFPMGSMTGAPKKRVLELTNQYEKTQRNLYSGSIGFINPAGDFDFNVVIRSMLYNEATNYLSYHVGGGITFYSNAGKEYEECLLKASAMNKVLGML